MKTIILTQNKVALVDDSDYEPLNAVKWYAIFLNRERWYARRKLPRDGGPAKTLDMHRVLIPNVSEVDHKNGDGLDNRRDNLRAATRAQNMANSRKRSGGSSQFKGVSWGKRDSIWQAKITKAGKCFYLGNFVLEKDAAMAYDAAAREYFGEFANINFKPTTKSTCLI